MKELFNESEIKEIPPGFRVLEVTVTSGKFYCLTNAAKKAVQGKYPRSSASIWREGNRLNGCGLGSS